MSLLNLLDQRIVMGQLQDVLGLAEREAAALYGQYNLFQHPVQPAHLLFARRGHQPDPRRVRGGDPPDHREVNRVVTTSFRLIAMLAIPAGVGLSVLAGPILRLLYPAQQEAAQAATYHLQLLGIASIFVCIMLLTNSIMQAHGKVQLPIYTMLAGGVVKVVINYVLGGQPGHQHQGSSHRHPGLLQPQSPW